MVELWQVLPQREYDFFENLATKDRIRYQKQIQNYNLFNRKYQTNAEKDDTWVTMRKQHGFKMPRLEPVPDELPNFGTGNFD